MSVLATAPEQSTAILSRDRKYRYRLTRRWGDGRVATFIMLNPSTADAHLNDPTVRRCIGFAKSWGLDGITVVNLYALRSTTPAALWRSTNPVGDANLHHLALAAFSAAAMGEPLVAAWGSHAEQERVDAALSIPHMDRLSCLGVNVSGSPRHPLYVRGDTPLTAWPVRAVTP